MNPPINPRSLNKLSKPIFSVAFFLMIFLFQGNNLFGNFNTEISKNTPTSEMVGCSKGLAFPFYGGVILDNSTTIPVCANSVNNINDIEFNIQSVVDPNALPVTPAGHAYFLRYIINNVVVTDPNVGANVTSTTLEGAVFPIEYNGPADATFNEVIQDGVSLSFPNDFLLTATVQYSITVQLMESTPGGDILSPACTPRGFVVTAEINPPPAVTAQLITASDADACADQAISLMATGTGTIQSFSWTVLSNDPGVSGSFSNPFSANTNFIGTADNSLIAKGESGTVTVQVTHTDGNGCSNTDVLDIEVFRAIGSLSCNDRVNISLADDCRETIEPDMVLEGSYGTYDMFEVLIFDQNRNIGNTVGRAQIGRNLTARVIDKCSGNSCWGYLTVEDKFAPVIDCSITNFKSNIITGTLDAGDNRFHRSVAVAQGNSAGCILSPVEGTNTLYETTNFNISVGGTYVFDMISSTADMFAGIYSGTFNPGDACNNIVIASDDGSPGNPLAPQLTAFLSPGDYVLVTSAHFNNGTGSYQWEITGPPAGGVNQGICVTNSDTISVACTFDVSLIPPPVAMDECDGIIIPTMIGETMDNFGCGRGDGTVEIYTRTWRATDSYGNVSNTCKQVIKLVRKTLSNIVFPPNFDDLDQPAFHCNDLMIEAHPDSIGYPTIDGAAVLLGNICKLNLDYEDTVLPTCGNGKKILRDWTILDWCQPLVAGVNPLKHTQVIKFIDKTPPAIVCPADFTTSANNNDCSASAVLPAILANDDCGDTVKIQISTPYGVLNTNGGVINGFPIGEHDITYTVRDECGNDTSCIVKMTVADELEPVAICIELLSVSLTSTGMAEINATAFDAGSYDNCCLDRFEVRRMTQRPRDYAPTVTFDCADVGNNPMVVVRVWDCYRNSNECMVEIEVEDKLRPTLICPPDITLNCDQDPFDLDVTGDVTNLEACDISVSNYSDEDLRDMCSIGEVIRTFVSTDASGNTGRCKQTITIRNNRVFNGNRIVWPLDTMFVDDCGRGISHPDDLPPGYNYPTYPQTFCASILQNWEDTRFSVPGDACFKVIRKWSIIDWCQYDSSNPLAGGRWEHEQEITLVDNLAPDITCPDSISVSVGHDCLATIQIDTAMATDCSNVFTHTISGDFRRYGRHNNISIGTYEVTLAVRDGCGNTSRCDVPIFVRDSVQPTPVCKAISVNLDTVNQMAWVHVNSIDPDSSSYDNCTDVRYSFSVHLDDTMRMFTCADTGVIDIRFYVTDAFFNSDYCTTTITVQDNWNICGGSSSGSKSAITGNIKNEDNEPVANVNIALSGMSLAPQKTGTDGAFEFKNLNSGDDYSIFPTCNEDFDNGVSTFDILQISRHILNVEKLNSPYKLIAADANRSASISTLDIIALRKLVLQTATDLPNQNPSWRFVKSNYNFPNPTNPWAEVFPEIHNVNNLTSDTRTNFTAIKIGDVNGDADMTNSLAGITPRIFNEQLTFQVQNQFFEKGESIQVDFTAADFENILGYQATIRFDNDIFDLTEVLPGAIAGEENFGKAFLNEGILTTSWNTASAENFDAETILFSLVFNTNRAGDLESTLAFDGSRTKAESYRNDGEMLGVNLEVKNEISVAQLFQNEPNPFSEKTMIRFFLPEKTKATLTVVDISGKVVKVFSDEYERGTTEIELYKSDLPAQSVLYYSLRTADFNGVKKMLLIQ